MTAETTDMPAVADGAPGAAPARPAPTVQADGSPVLTVADYIDEAYVFLGAGAAVLLQMAMPGVGHGVADHSDTLSDPLGRLRTTMSYIYAVSIGTDAERKAIVEMVNKAHIPVRGEGYNAFDPKLQLWVAATLYHGGIDLHERLHGPMDPASAEAIYRESQAYGTALQVRDEMWPEDLAGFREYWDSTVAELAVDGKVLAYARNLLKGGSAPWYIRIGMPLNRLVTTGLLPEQVRRAYRLKWSRPRQLLFDTLFRVIRVVYPWIPRAVRTLPARYYLNDLRKRIRDGRPIAR